MLWQTASEEVLRYYAPVTMARKVVGETEVAGCPVHPGDQMLLPFPAANHDPPAFEAPHEFRLDRAQNRHGAFGLGVHRCVGSNLARLELLVALQEWLRVPRYELDTSRPTTWANGRVRGPATSELLRDERNGRDGVGRRARHRRGTTRQARCGAQALIRATTELIVGAACRCRCRDRRSPG
ncbi:MAG: cytochrome P450 [Ilumatobacteraceae bacterium]